VPDRGVQASYLVVCPHCGKTFEGELLTAARPARSRGFKCPHCRLFVPFERANSKPLGNAAG
jgi:DNA-directed RNA polymerase subunit RPC12/RpoP